MKNGLKLWSINTGAYLQEAKRLYNKGLFDYIELYVLPQSIDTLKVWREVDIPFIIHNAHFAHGFNLALASMREENLKIYEETKQFADELHSPYIIFHGGTDGCIEETALQLRSFNEPRALIENKPYVALPYMKGDFCRAATIEEIKHVIDVANCRFCFDFGHAICAANSLGIEPYSYIEDFMSVEAAVYHLTDIHDMTSPYDAHPHLGTGELDIARILSLIPSGSYVTYETDKCSQDDLDDFERDMLYLRGLSNAPK